MRVTSVIVLSLFSASAAGAASFLTAQKFPKTFNDLTFVDRMRVLAEGYEPWESEYDLETGRCITNCPYDGITIDEATELSRRATADLSRKMYQEGYPVAPPDDSSESDIIVNVPVIKIGDTPPVKLGPKPQFTPPPEKVAPADNTAVYVPQIPLAPIDTSILPSGATGSGNSTIAVPQKPQHNIGIILPSVDSTGLQGSATYQNDTTIVRPPFVPQSPSALLPISPAPNMTDGAHQQDPATIAPLPQAPKPEPKPEPNDNVPEQKPQPQPMPEDETLPYQPPLTLPSPEKPTKAEPSCTPHQPDIAAGQTRPFGEPLVGKPRISSNYGFRCHPIKCRWLLHSGVDFSVPTGTTVFTPADGTVEIVRNDGKKGCGKWIQIDHGKGVKTKYCHLSSFLVKKGDKVEAGCAIAKSGNTGSSTGPHLHYTIINSGIAVDAHEYFPNKRRKPENPGTEEQCKKKCGYK